MPTAAAAAILTPQGGFEADPRELDTFVQALFRYADAGAHVSWRAFRDDRKDAPPVFIESSHVLEDGLGHLATAATYWATKAAQHPDPVVFCPPIATFTSAKRAREIDLANGLALSVECDAHPQRARQLLEQLLGPATVVVASGGVWSDPVSQELHEKLHLHWRLAEPTSDAGEHARLKRARILATRLAGGDATNIPAVHPIRWPGSWHRKASPRLARIVVADLAREVTLTDALAQLELAAVALPPDKREQIPTESWGTHEGVGNPTAELVRQLMTGEAIHAPLCALAWRYLLGGMSDAMAVTTLRGMLDAIPVAVRGEPGRWEGHYGDVPRTVRSAREKIGHAPPGGQAADLGDFVASFTPSPPAIIIARPADRPMEIPAELLIPPGVLGDVARYGVETAVRPVPIFAAQAALALGSVVLGRRYVTSQRNYASLYFLNVAKSGTGKEEAKTTIERVLTAAGVRRLVGPSAYSSGNAVFSALLRKPAHIAIIDEFGKYMEAAAKEYDNYRADTIKQLMEAFGRVHGDMATPQFSTMTMSAAAGADIEPKVIQRPSITLLAMTTPSSFYDAMRSARIQDGFLNRFIIAEHAAPRTPAGEWRDIPVPQAAVDWVHQMLAPHCQMDMGVLVDGIPDAALVEFTPDALERTKLFERKMLALSEQLDREGLGDMPIRSRELGMRLSLICALSDTPDTPTITTDIVDWCFSYVEFFLHQTLHSLRTRVADSTTERTRNQVLAAIRLAGERGVTNRDLNRGKAFIGLPKRDRQDAIESLLAAELVAWATVQTPGRARVALVALDDAGAEPSLALHSESHPQDDAA
jgi:hypothetical protein